ncbi:MAG: hypothetical protein GXC73_05560 [Chitinophagaceae bacterium]|nr:hypothetical protein [Chitinophagaceae bacterium]
MNKISQLLLKAVLLPAPLYTKMGVHMPHLKAILTSKLIMDDRRPNSIRQVQQNKNEKAVSNATLGTMFIALLTGLFFLLAFMFGNSYATSLTFYFSFYIFMLAGILISDFTTVLIDVRDNYILLPKPVNDKTIVVSRLLHIVVHLSKVVLPMSIPGIITVFVQKGIGGALLMVPLFILATLLTIFVINAVYLLILKITTPAKFQSIITYFQIFFAVLIFASYQVVPRMIERSAMQNIDVSSYSFIWLLPSYWFGEAWESLYTLTFTASTVAYIAAAFFVPAIAIWAVVKIFAPTFTQKLAQINAGSSEQLTKQPIKTKVEKKSFAEKLASVLTAKGAERAGFLFTWKMMSRNRDFKIKVYPSIGYLFVYFFIFFFRGSNRNFDSFTDPERMRPLFIGIIYFSTLLLITALQHIVISEKWKASWIWHLAPLQAPGKILNGSITAALTMFFLPLAILISFISVSLWGVAILPNLFMGMCAQLFICVVLSKIMVRKLPFSSPPVGANSGGNFLRTILFLFIAGSAGALHYFLFNYNYILLVAGAVLLAISYLLIQQTKKTTWLELNMNYNN